MEILSLDAVRGLMIAAQGLHDAPKPRATKKAVRSIIRQMHILQIDSINVIARSPYLVLWSRLGDYNPRWLDELLAEGALFEYWSHAACFLPIEEYPLYRHLHDRWMGGRAHQWLEEHRTVAETVLNHVRAHGETRARVDAGPQERNTLVPLDAAYDAVPVHAAQLRGRGHPGPPRMVRAPWPARAWLSALRRPLPR